MQASTNDTPDIIKIDFKLNKKILAFKNDLKYPLWA